MLVCAVLGVHKKKREANEVTGKFKKKTNLDFAKVGKFGSTNEVKCKQHRLTVSLMPLSAALMRRKTRAARVVISFCCDGLITPPNILLHIAAAHKSCARECALFQKCAPRSEQRLPAGDMENRAYS